jgi:SulP family sulfate permease
MSGASGAVAVVIAPLVAQYGVEYLPACAILAGIIQCTAGKLKLGKWIRLVPHPVMVRDF